MIDSIFVDGNLYQSMIAWLWLMMNNDTIID